MEKPLVELSLIELKAMAYDVIAEKEFLQQRLNAINQAIAEKYKQEQTTTEQKP